MANNVATQRKNTIEEAAAFKFTRMQLRSSLQCSLFAVHSFPSPLNAVELSKALESAFVLPRTNVSPVHTKVDSESDLSGRRDGKGKEKENSLTLSHQFSHQ